MILKLGRTHTKDFQYGGVKLTPDPRAIVLVSTTGSGKTVAARKAFLDCTMAPRSLQPLLANYVPCWAKLPGTIINNHIEQYGEQHENCLHLLLLQGLASIACSNTEQDLPLSLIVRELKLGPPVLIFLDLNAYSSSHQQLVAKAIIQFQKVFGCFGHRCVVSYRDGTSKSETPDKLPDKLKDDRGEHIGLYSIKHATSFEAESYFENFHKFRAELSDHIPGWSEPPLTSEQNKQTAAFRELLDRYLEGNTSAELVSTPLFMHLATVLPDSDWSKVHTLADLYGILIDKAHLNVTSNHEPEAYEKSSLGKDRGKFGKHLKNVICTRFALHTLSNASTTQSPYDDLDCLLDSPDFNPLTKRTPQWFNVDRLWQQSGIYSNTQDWPAEQHPGTVPPEEAIQYTLLMRDGDQVRFPHDSMLYYFAGVVALIEYQLPRSVSRLTQSWIQATARRLALNPSVWRLPAAFLAMKLFSMDVESGIDDPEQWFSLQVFVELMVQAIETKEPLAMVRLLESYVGAISHFPGYRKIQAILYEFGSDIRKQPAHLIPLVLSYEEPQFRKALLNLCKTRKQST
ncbi:hypothetical protein [Gimesia chilikensis]|uniref:hypothetical protein n=1 Tax=Gimesia chilikensis TaxID=2605989 RepID=UPI0011A5ECF8|nr:hypothetical protein [Gimesia chilikensis]